MSGGSPQPPPDGSLRLRLYVAGGTGRSDRAEESLRAFASSAIGEHGSGWDLEVVDVRTSPDRAEEDRILATPTLIRLAPAPVRRVIGDLTDTQQLRSLIRPYPERS